MRKFLPVLMLALLLSVPSTAGSAAKQLKPNTVDALQVHDNTICTVFSVNKAEGLWGTCAHCVVDMEQVEGIRKGMTIAHEDASLVYLDVDYDLAVLHTLHGAKALQLGDYLPMDTQKNAIDIMVVGFPFGLPRLVVTRGYVASRLVPIDGWHISDVNDVTSAGGNSGAPVLHNGKLVGVHWGSYPDKPFSLMTPLEFVARSIGSYFEVAN